MSEQLDPVLLEAAVLGKQVEAFIQSDVGQYLLIRAASELDETNKSLLTCDPFDGNLVANLQAKAYRAASFRTWLEEAVLSGLNAHSLLEEREDG